jgi:hypothetical protein
MLVSEPRPSALGRHASNTLDHQEPERGVVRKAVTTAKGRGTGALDIKTTLSAICEGQILVIIQQVLSCLA